DLFKLSISEGGFPFLSMIGLDGRVLAFTLGISLAVGILMGLAPALQFSRPDCNESLKQGARGSGGPARQRTRNVLVVGQVALAGILLTGAGISVTTLWKLFQTRTGFNPENLFTTHVHLSGPRYSTQGPKREAATRLLTPAVEDFYAELLRRV